MHQKPDIWHIGNVTITRIVEIETLLAMLAFLSKKAIITGDVFHHPIEMEYPELPGNFDVDLKAAERTRVEFLKTYSGSDVLILGTHFSFPTAGWIIQNGKTWRFNTTLR